MGWREQNEILEERKRLEHDIRRFSESFEEIDKEFNKWKEGVLVFEHSEYSSDDNSGDDDWVCDGECVWSTEDENDIQRSSEQID